MTSRRRGATVGRQRAAGGRRSPAEIARMREAGRLVAQVLELVGAALRPGVTARELDQLAEAHIRAAGGEPSFKGYRMGASPPFPGTICVSIDDEVVHGLPDERRIRAGQVVSIDAGAIVDGWHGDGARTFFVGDPPPEIARLLVGTRAALEAGIAAARPGASIADVSGAIEDVGRRGPYGIVRECVGHGIGRRMHEPPDVPNYRTGAAGLRLEPGMCLALEPMFTLGRPEIGILEDGWTIVTMDGSPAAHFEHTIAITASGAEVLTLP